MKCEVCRGACCETFSLPINGNVPLAGDVIQGDVNRWVALHATVTATGLEFECRCTQLGNDGRCRIYESRPVMCRTYKAGGPDCLEAVKKRRTRLEHIKIREHGDPVVVNG